jgi:hypothetical protein
MIFFLFLKIYKEINATFLFFKQKLFYLKKNFLAISNKRNSIINIKEMVYIERMKQKMQRFLLFF